MDNSEKEKQKDYVAAFAMIRYLYHGGKISKDVFEDIKKDLEKKINTVDITEMF